MWFFRLSFASRLSFVSDLTVSFFLFDHRNQTGEAVEFTPQIDPHLVAGVLKSYLRDLPEPLFSFNFYPKFVQAAGMCFVE